MRATRSHSLDVKEETAKLVLNTASLELGDVSLQSGTSDGAAEVQTATAREFDETNERGIFSFAKALPAGSKARLSVAFKGELTGDMLGYYRSTGGPDGKIKYTLTQFEVQEVYRQSLWSGSLKCFLAVLSSLRLQGGRSRAGTSRSSRRPLRSRSSPASTRST